MDGLEGSSRRLQEAIDSPRRTKLKVSGGTQTAGGDDGKGPPGSTRAPGSIRAPDLEARKIIDADEHGFEDFYQNSQQKSAGSGNMQLSSSTRERLIASQRRPANTVSGFTKPRTRLGRGGGSSNPQSFSNGYFSDSNEGKFVEVQPPSSEKGTPSWQGAWTSGGTGVWQSDGDGGVWYNGGWVQQGYSSLDNYYITREHTRESMRAANSLESLDSVSSSIQQARASSSTVQPPRTGSSTVQPQRTGSGTVQPPRTGSGTVQPVRTGSSAPARANPVNSTLTPPTQARSSPLQPRTTPVQIRKFSNNQDSGNLSPLPLRMNRSNSVSNQMTTGVPEFQKTFPLRKPTTEDSEYYGVPVQLGRGLPVKRQRQFPNSWAQGRTNNQSVQQSSNHMQDEGLAGSLSSLASLGHISSTSYLAEDKSSGEIQRLRKELREEQEKTKRLTSQLSTNTHVVSAFEQSLSNMTTRLQQLTRSADEKDKELHELHKTIELLQRQGAQLGLGKYQVVSSESLYNTPGRNGFISAGTSDSENEEYNSSTNSKRTFNFKHKKSKWLQQSISRAFSRARKHSGSVSEADDRQRRHLKTVVDTATSCPGSPLPRGHHRSRSAPVLDDGEGSVDELRQQLIQKESLLTETRLEALTSAHQLQTLRETIAKLRNELNTVRRESEKITNDPAFNSPAHRTSSPAHRTSSPAHPFIPLAHTSGSPALSTRSTGYGSRFNSSSPAHGSRLELNSRTSRSGSELSKSPELRSMNLAQSSGGVLPHRMSKVDYVDGIPGSGSNERRPRKTKPLSSYSESPIRRPLGTGGGGEGGVRGQDQQGCSLLQTSCSVDTDAEEVCVPVSVISTGDYPSQLQLSYNPKPRRTDTKIGFVTISRNSSWPNLDDCVRGLVKTYLNKLDPENSLELTNQSIVSYQCGNIRRVFKTPEPVGGPSLLQDTRIWVSFRTGTDRGSLEDLAFSTLIPKTVIKKYVMTLSKYRRAVIVGHQGVGKTFLALKLAEFLALKTGNSLNPVHVLSLDQGSYDECKEAISSLTLVPGENQPSVIILENIHAKGSRIVDLLSSLELGKEDFPFLICTSSPSQYIRDLNAKMNMVEITLGEDVELMQGFLGRYLRRKMLEVEVETGLANFDMPEAIQWILRIYCNIYIFVKTTSRTRSCLSPHMFMSCAVGSTQALRSWFVEVWNTKVVFYLRDIVSGRGEEELMQFEDPVRFVIRTWPWQEQLGGLPQALLRVKTDSRGLKEELPSEDDPLLSMLLCLQEAALYSEESNRTSSNSIHKNSFSDLENTEGNEEVTKDSDSN